VHCTDPDATFSLQKHDKKVPDGEIAFVHGALQGAAAPDPKVTPCVTCSLRCRLDKLLYVDMHAEDAALPASAQDTDTTPGHAKRLSNSIVRQIHCSPVPIDRERAAARWLRPPCGFPSSSALFLHPVQPLMTPGYSG
jgi:hypothetical protein